MPSEVHESHMTWVKDVMGQWLQQGTLTFPEYRHLKLLASPRQRFTQGPYSGSIKEPDACMRPDNLVRPTFVVEAGWSEPRRELLDDMNLWLVGGNGEVNAVLILDWRRIGTSNRVEGVADLYVRDRQGMLICQQREQIFPAPNPQQAANQAIHVTRRVLFGPTVSQGRNPREVLNMSVDFLRSSGREQMSLMGLVPA
ncbi:uncharacterized protein LDX57_009967 [Aspergillus melleus]|uniref:uncharacterized protein n=1 Tax=Aspergillus melleus TaxID=138277 RepID=UPI001E8EB92F|nr:uncharacterized protein LDX57_009967 [Aspergillus melleus]KAH8432329.1 hypothetical protein LDX57_009967 [Aspergillus melleus]